MKKEKNKILTIGGGRGQYSLLSGLRDLKNISVTSVVSVADNGGSSGRLRNELGILPPGDILKCIVALSPLRDIAEKILLKRLNGNRRLNGHNAGNMLLTMLTQYIGSFTEAIKTLSELIDSTGKVLPTTTDKATLVAELSDGTRIYGETAIDIPRKSNREKIANVFLVPHYSNCISPYPPAIEEIKKSDFIFIGPGDLYTSIIAGLIVPGIKEAIKNSSAKIFYILNIMTKFGETQNFRGYDFIQKIENCIGRQLDGVIYNVRKPNNQILKNYFDNKSEFVELDKSDGWIGNCRIFKEDLLDTSSKTAQHDPHKLASLIKSIIFTDNGKFLRRSYNYNPKIVKKR